MKTLFILICFTVFLTGCVVQEDLSSEKQADEAYSDYLAEQGASDWEVERDAAISDEASQMLSDYREEQMDRIDQIAEDAGWTDDSRSGGTVIDGCADGCEYQKAGCDIKGNISVDTGEKIYHVPGQEFYDETKISPEYGERWFCTEEEARNNGWRQAKN